MIKKFLMEDFIIYPNSCFNDYFNIVKKIINIKELIRVVNNYIKLFLIKNKDIINEKLELSIKKFRGIDEGILTKTERKILNDFIMNVALYLWEKITFEHPFKNGNKRIGYYFLKVAENETIPKQIMKWMGEN